MPPIPAPSPEQWRLSAGEVRARFDPVQLPFETTAELPYEESVIGQERAVRAMDFGLHIQDHGYNIFVCGIPGTGKSTIIKSMIRQVAETRPTPGDWCYVHNFRDPDHPRALSLPPGKGREFQRDMEHLITSLKEEFPRVFQSKDYEEQREHIEEEFSKARDALSEKLDAQAKEHGFLVKGTRVGIILVPLHKGEPLNPEQFEALPENVREEIQQKEKAVREEVANFLDRVRALREEMAEKIAQLNLQVALYTSEHLFDSLRTKYQPFPKVVDYLQAVQQDVLENVQDFLAEQHESAAPMPVPGLELEPARRAMIRYAVNVVVDNSATRGAPFVEETNPTYNNLIGRIEKKAHLGFLYTDFTLIKAGSILQANGGYLLVNALDVLQSPFAWNALKRIVMKRELKIEDIAETYGFAAASGIKPEPIPITLRVILVGSPYLFYLLQEYEEDFPRIFKVKADFDVQQNLRDQSPLQYSFFIARLCKDKGLLHFDRGAVAAVLEQAARWVDHQKKLSLRFGDLSDLLHESSFWAAREGKSLVSRSHVQRAIKEWIHRSNLLEERIQDLIAEGTLMVDVSGAVAGQINGLSVYDLGGFSFGRPSRITARVFLGQTGIVNIEREAKLSGKTHSKGVLILSGLLGGRYARDIPLSLSASIGFEQSYGEVEGDSASAAELIALLSAIAGIPLRQDLAITGSINQRGELQAIGGVNEKIEGFFATCNALGMTGTQGVIIPRRNAQHLMLKEEVVEAIDAGRFHVYAVYTVDEALEILTGLPAGELQPDGTYPDGTVNAAVLGTLHDMDARLRALESKGATGFPSESLEEEEEEEEGEEENGEEDKSH
ncbi:MAG: AAA family ATPase [Gammaproteobacteria bacterium]|nr:AAA family ATPase [Gammaproteobacteria bacterium]